MTLSNVQQPWLFRDEARELARNGPWGDGDWPDVEPETIEYGTPLDQLLRDHDYLGDFLQAAALAGHVNPSAIDGIFAAIAAIHLMQLREIDECEQRDALGDTLGACDADHYRRAVIVLEEMIVDLETQAARIHRLSGDHGDAETLAECEHEARAAEARATRARTRVETIRAEIAAS
jgi:hypothetical protein